ncbi:hypothetical protein MLD38_038086 [Melastoma candidum]|uniref:Uncharacterized protein n=1 Tax=Melastoma candidum TaxID=119954 RepID=A0ACB9KYF1_9MYRT|nr:hypothetical protein MLD38_038086 [Melastoma candidum]
MSNLVMTMDSRCPEGKGLDPKLWHACAGGMVQIPPVNSRVIYFPQGHAEHSDGRVEFGNSRLPPFVLCRVAGIKYLADPDSDEIFAKMRLMPLRSDDCSFEDGDDGWSGNEGVENPEKASSFAKTLTQSDANNGGGFSVPRYCAETIFPRLDYSAKPPVQTIVAKDVHGQLWKFRHIYRGTPRRHLLTTGWSNFVSQKKLVAGDSIVFLRADDGDLCVGIRRAKRGIGLESSCGWNSASGNPVPQPLGYNMFNLENGGHHHGMQVDSDSDIRRKVTAESVTQAVALAAKGHLFDVIFYPRAGTPEFFVRASSVNAAMQIQWCQGMRFKMPFETEDASRISWFMGTISNVQVADPIRWPNSPWRLLQVAWDEPDLLQNVKSVSPWLVELVSSMPSVHLSAFSPSRKRLRTSDCLPMDPVPVPSFPNSPWCCVPGNIPAGIQGARHSARFGSSPPDLSYNHQINTGPDPFISRLLGYPAVAPKLSTSNFLDTHEGYGYSGVTCLLEMGNTQPRSKDNEKKVPYIVLFGQTIPAEQQTSDSASSGDTMGKCSSNSSNYSDGCTETGHCKVFVESDEVGRTLDLSLLRSYEELYKNMADIFGIDGSEMARNIMYSDAAGEIKHAGDEPFSDFLRTAKRLTIPAAVRASKT